MPALKGSQKQRDSKKAMGRYAGLRHPFLILAAILIVLAAFSFCVDGLFLCRLHTPVEAFRAILLWIRIGLGSLTDSGIYHDHDAIVAGMPYYGGVIARVKITGFVFVCGMLMALSGSVFQTVFRNPMAAPTMLGVSTGVNIGVLILVVQFGSMAYHMTQRKYLYCYVCVAVILLIVLLLGKISSGKKRLSVFDLLLVGTVISQIVGAVVSFYTFAMDNDVVLVYQEIVGAINMDISGRAWLTLLVAALIGIVPMFCLRFSFNAVSFETDDMKSLGISAYGMRIVTLVLGSVMIAAGMVHCGTAGMISLVAPFLSRGLFGADFKKQFWGNLLMGGCLLVACKDVVGLIPFARDGIPLGTMVDFMVVPLFVLIVASQKRTWE